MPADTDAYALLDALFANAPVGLGFWDPDLRYRRVNAALASINGLPPDEHVGLRPSDVLGEIGVVSEDVMARVLDDRLPRVELPFEGETPAMPGEVRHFRASFYPVVDRDGELLGCAAVVLEVSAEHNAVRLKEEALREALAAREAAEDARARADVLVRAGERLALVTRDYEATLQEVAAFAVPALADRCTFTLVDRRGVARKVAVAPAGETGPLTVPPAVLQVLETQEAQLSARTMVVPLLTRGRTIGALRMERAAGSRPFTGDDLRTAELFAVRAALSVENARLYTERSHIAQTLQRSLLPPALPDVPGLELAARYRAAGEQNEVGGDFYDAFRSGDGAWTVIIGDVSGKGAEAAALTSLTRHTLRAASLRTLDPIENLRLLDEALRAQNDPAGRFTTVLYAQVQPDAHGAEVTLATGGHLPPVLLRAGGRVERVQLRGAIVGALKTPHFGERRVRLEHGDTLLMFTDGVVELRRSPRGGVRSGDAALEEVLTAHRGASAAELVEAVERRAVELQGGDPRDDIALVAIRPCP